MTDVDTLLAAAREAQVATVFKGDRLAGTLVRTAETTTFAYDAAYVADGGPPVATTLPVGGTVRVPAGAVPPFFAGLLPEGRRLTALRRAVKTSADDELSLLIAVGADPVGDVRIGLDDLPPPSAQPLMADLAVGSFADLLQRLDLVAIAGVQDKVSAAMINLPVTVEDQQGAILKLDPPEFPHLVHNEAFFLRAAARSGLPVAEAEVVHDGEGRPGLLVQRFDRALVDGVVVRFAQEDGCQVAGRYPADKYRLTVEEVVAALASVTDARAVAARDALRQVAFAYLTGNGDLHAKNLSVRQLPSGEWRLTPAYDLPSSHPYGDTTMALSLAGCRREDITRRTFIEAGAALGVPPRAISRVLDDLCDAVDVWLPDLDQLPFDDRRIHRLRRLVEGRRRKLAPPRNR